MITDDLSRDEYRALAEFRYALRRFLHFSEQAAHSAGLEPQQHQLLLAVKGHGGDAPPTIGEVAERLLLHHHSTVELINRSAQQGLVERQRDAVDRRRVRVRLTPAGDAVLHGLSLAHRAELRSAVPDLVCALNTFALDTPAVAGGQELRPRGHDPPPGSR
jgi:DNA-binding MarR family transcriptional regulator